MAKRGVHLNRVISGVTEQYRNALINAKKMSMDKLMDGPVDNLMDNSSSYPQVAAQAAHKLTHDGFIK